MTKTKSRVGLIETKVFFTTLIILGTLYLVAGFASYFIPAGQYQENIVNDQPIKVYQRIAQTPIPVWKIIAAPLLSVTGKNGIKIITLILFIVLIGGSFSIMYQSGVLPALVIRIVERFRNRKTLFLVLTVFIFSLLGAGFGCFEELMPMIMIFVPIAYRMGWDSMTGVALPLLSTGFGFSAAMFNPFTVGTAQKLADLPLFSGLPLRLLIFLITTTLVIFYLIYYTRKIEKHPTRSLTHESDRFLKQKLSEEPGIDNNIMVQGPVIVMVICFILVITVVLGGMVIPIIKDYSFPMIALLFVIMGFGVGFASGDKSNAILKYFGKGLLDFSPTIIIILMAASTGYMIEIGNIMDTLLFHIANLIQGASQGMAAILLYFFQMLMNFLVPSGTGLAILTIPIMAPLADIIGISRQTVVLAYQFGDGFSNLIWPTNPLLHIAIGFGSVSYKNWVKWVLPIQLCLFIICCLFLLLAVAIHY
ncbi:MAG: TIGR00366 family protein [bacterium]|jgi:uncharacterized ion transporter superfamily protein YfcC|nr:TIGR00366 family protein [bacterium]